MIFFHLWLQSIQYDLQHDFAWVTDEAYCSVVLALLKAAFLGKCDDYGLGPWGWPFSCLPNLAADCSESGDYIVSICLDQFPWDVSSLNFSAKDGVVILCVCLGAVRY